MARQTLVIGVDEQLARRVLNFVQSGDHGYATLDEFAAVALSNQLSLEETGRTSVAPESLVARSLGRPASRYDRPNRDVSRQTVHPLLAMLPGAPTLSLADRPRTSTDELFVLTNRLSPVKIAARALGNLGEQGEWPELSTFHTYAPQAARDLGLVLRDEDRKSMSRRWVAYPIAEDARKATDRFVSSFTISASDGAVAGPMALLGLANVANGRVALTEAGWRVATAPSPLIDGADGITLSAAESRLLRECVRGAPGELAAVKEFLAIARRAGGSQRRVDELLNAREPSRSAVLVIAQRAAMLGRLVELELLSTSGRGPGARIELLPAGEEFLAIVTENPITITVEERV